MAKIVQINASNKFTNKSFKFVAQALKESKKSDVAVFLTEDGLADCDHQRCFHITMKDKFENFALYKSLRELIVKQLGVVIVLDELRKIELESSFSTHICKKVADFVENGYIYFNREAQFPPDVIRRPEKTVYFATTFNMICTKLFVSCGKKIIDSSENGLEFSVSDAQNLDRCSLRLLQNMVLTFKPYQMIFRLYFRKKDNARYLNRENIIEAKYKFARTRCFTKLIHGLIAAGSCQQTEIFIKDTLESTDFLTSVPFIIEGQSYGEQVTVEDFRDMVYRSNYEAFYVYYNEIDQMTYLTPQDIATIKKLEVLCDSYTYQFGAALNSIAQYELHKDQNELHQDQNFQESCFFALIKGLIELKKMNSAKQALRSLEEGLLLAEQIEDKLTKAIEVAFMTNALNYVRLVESTMMIQDTQARQGSIDNIVESEHQLLQSLCNAFLSAPFRDFKSESNLLNALFMITTLVENIGKLNSLCGRHDETIALYANYQYIHEVISNRMETDEYKKSFVISYSHAMVHSEMQIASGYRALGNYKKAYELTVGLLEKAKNYDMTGNYRGYLLNACAVNAMRIGKTDEAFGYFQEMSSIFYDYNEPFMIRAAVNQIEEYLFKHDFQSHKVFSDMGFVDKSCVPHNEFTFMASSAVDLENYSTPGMEKVLFEKLNENEPNEYKNLDRALADSYKVYGLWRQVAQL